ncbi:MAG: TrmH family RNA methyltransferase, partial [Nitrospinota bacterium]
MKNLGYKNLHLVSPTAYGHLAAMKLTQGAEDLLESAPVHATPDEAAADYHMVFPTSRKMKQENALSLVEASEIIAGLAQKNRIAVLFGSEKFGLARSAVDKCQKVITLPVAPEFPSVNLAQSVGMVCLEIRLRLMEREEESTPPIDGTGAEAAIHLTVEERQRLYKGFDDLFNDLGFDAPSIYGKVQDV